MTATISKNHPPLLQQQHTATSNGTDKLAPSMPTTTKTTMTTTTTTTTTPPTTKSLLKSRSRIPASIVVSWSMVFLFQLTSGMYSNYQSVASSWVQSCELSAVAVQQWWRDMWHVGGWTTTTMTLVWHLASALFSLACLYTLIYAPLRAGMWTGARAKRDVVHRYMGLAFLIQYALAWAEYMTDYSASAQSFLPQSVALNGLIQATSAYFSFRVLPNLEDAGYYSDKAVLSRSFVHENIFYQLCCVWGSVYYHDSLRHQLRSSWIGQALEIVLVFFPYVLLRPLFPVTRFKNAGTSRAGRSSRNEEFYRIGTLLIKFFYLWAKYYLGLYINWLVFLEIPTASNWKFIRGLFLLNVGTVSISVFLHTLRFKKVLPPKLTFSIYLAQIYATFLAIPYLYDLFASQAFLVALAFAGILCNMTRSRTVHAIWCVVVFAVMWKARLEKANGQE